LLKDFFTKKKTFCKRLKLKVSVVDNEGKLKRTKDVFLEIADAIGNLNDKGDRIDIAEKIFGDTGFYILPLLEKKSKGIRELIQEARNLGLVIDNIPADDLNRVYAKLFDLDKRFQGTKNSIASQFIPFINTEIIPSIDKAREHWDKFSEAFGYYTSDAVGFELQQLREYKASIQKELNDLTSEYNKLENQTSSWFWNFLFGPIDINEKLKKAGELFEKIKKLKEELLRFEGILNKEEIRYFDTRKVGANFENITEDLKENTKEFEAVDKKLTPTFDSSWLSSFQNSITNVTTLVDNLCIAFENLILLKDEINTTSQTIPVAGKIPTPGKPAATPPSYAEPYDNMREGSDQAAGEATSAWDNFFDGFRSQIENTERVASDSWSEMGSAMADPALDAFSSMQDGFGTLFNALLTDADNSRAVFQAFFDDIKNAFFNLISQMMAKLAMSGLLKMLSSLIPGFGGLLGSIGGGLELPFFKEGGIAGLGTKSLPKIPHAQKGLITRGREPIPAILHPDGLCLKDMWLNSSVQWQSGYSITCPCHHCHQCHYQPMLVPELQRQ